MSVLNGDWDQNRKYVLEKLERLEEKTDKILTIVTTMKAEQMVLKSKIAMFGGSIGTVCGAIAGAIVAAVLN